MIGAGLVASYLVAIVAANFAVAHFGQAALVFTAFVLIPFDLVARDALHERWSGNRLAARMALLVLSGSALSAALSWDVARVALASALAFGSAGLVDAVVYHALRRRGRLVKMNASNAFSSVTDSVIFPLVAFWPTIDPLLSASQAASKFVGGVFWSLVFVRAARLWRSK